MYSIKFCKQASGNKWAGLGSEYIKSEITCRNSLTLTVTMDGIDEMDKLESINDPEDIYDFFVQAKRMNTIVASFDRLKAAIGVEKDAYGMIFPALKKSLTSWKCASLWKLLDQRAGQKEYKNLACSDMTILIIGGGPVGLRAAIECRMLGCKVVIVDKRTRITRNNVLHLWPFTIEDLKQLGAKKFYGKFCAGAIDHISKYPDHHRL